MEPSMIQKVNEIFIVEILSTEYKFFNNFTAEMEE